ncbi:MAG: hypothetical protein HWD58_19220 [Bacteroidota bacterium]|nr:MAG: hypothetical protein HWD58_19220 [Bacteroidota bacterium]
MTRKQWFRKNKDRINGTTKLILGILLICISYSRCQNQASKADIRMQDLMIIKGTLVGVPTIEKGSKGYRSINFAIKELPTVTFSNGGLYYSATNVADLLKAEKDDIAYIGIWNGDISEYFNRSNNYMVPKKSENNVRIDFYSLVINERQLVDLVAISNDLSDKFAQFFAIIPLLVILLMISGLKDIKLL